MSYAIPSPPPDASATRRGLMGLGVQRFAGAKTYAADLATEGALLLGNFATGSLPAAAGRTGGLAWDTSTASVKASNGSAWSALAWAADLTSHTGASSGAHAATAISVAPSGNLAATNAQAGLVELQGDIDSLGASLSSLSSTVGGHTTDIAGLTTDLSTVAGALSAHLADALDAHDASAISVVPAGNLSSTQVQAALEELQASIDGFASTVSTAAPITGDGSGGSPITMAAASAAAAGYVTTGAQEFAGAKTFTGAISASNLSGTNTGDVSLGTANGLALVGQALSLDLATTGTAGALSAADKTKLDALSGTNTGDFTLGAFGSTPSAEGASRSAQVLTLQPASASFPGGVSTTTQSFAGAKTFTEAVAISDTTAAALVVDTSTFAVDALNDRVGIGTASPSARLHLAAKAVTAGTGTISGGTGTSTITGVGTAFTTQLAVGDVLVITSNGDVRTVTAIASDTSLTSDGPTSNTVSGSAFSFSKPSLRSEDSAGTYRVLMHPQNERALSLAAQARITWALDTQGIRAGGGGYLELVGGGVGVRVGGAGFGQTTAVTITQQTVSGGAFSSASLTLDANTSDGASAVALILRNAQTFANAGAKILSIRNVSTEKVSILAVGGDVTAHGTSPTNAGFYSLAASGSVAFAASTVGARMHLGSTSRYLKDNATDLEIVGCSLVAVDPTTAQQVATKAYVDALIPPVGGNGAPLWEFGGFGMGFKASGFSGTAELFCCPAVTTTGSTGAAAPVAGTYYSQGRFIQKISVGTAGASAGIRTSAASGLGLWRGDAAGVGGFLYWCRFAMDTVLSTSRSFFGLVGGGTDMGNIEPSAYASDLVGIGNDTGDANFSIIHGPGTSNTKVSLGSNFPAQTADAVYDLFLYCAPNSSTITYTVRRLDVAQEATGTLSTNLPASTTFFNFQAHINNGATASIVRLGIGTMWARTTNQ